MTKQEVQDLIGEENMDGFFQWMCGQTFGTDADGTYNYYTCDVNAFKAKLDSGYDRQQDPEAGD